MRIKEGFRAALMMFVLIGVAFTVACEAPTTEEDVSESSVTGTWYEYFTCEDTGDNVLAIWKFDDDGTLSVKDNSNETTGTWSLSGSTLSVTLSTKTVVDSSDCAAATGSYEYSVSASDDELVLTSGKESVTFYSDAATAREHLN